MHLHEETIGGLTAGVAGTAIGYPLDLIKTRLQTATACSGKNCSLLAILREIVRRGKRLIFAIDHHLFLMVAEFNIFLLFYPIFDTNRGLFCSLQRIDSSPFIILYLKCSQLYHVFILTQYLSCQKWLGCAKWIGRCCGCSNRCFHFDCR